jgi:hypothetical protein
VKIRVWVSDVWDNLEMDVDGSQTFAQVKSEGLLRSVGESADPDDYEVKFRGALVKDEAQTLDAAKIPDGAPMIILASARRPVT